MSAETSVRRRGFVKLCATAALAVGSNPRLLAQTGDVARLYERVALVDQHGIGITPERLAVGQCYVFDYPYRATPCFLLNLGRPVERSIELRTEQGEPYLWPGGLGPRRSVVAFAAICAHKMSYPTGAVSFISYRHERVSFRDADANLVERDGVIYCCSEKSVYDPAAGGRVLGGPAKQPLATILLQEGPNGMIHALGTAGGEMYRSFFERFSFRIALESGSSEVEALATERARVSTLDQYTHTLIQC